MTKNNNLKSKNRSYFLWSVVFILVCALGVTANTVITDTRIDTIIQNVSNLTLWDKMGIGTTVPDAYITIGNNFTAASNVVDTTISLRRNIDDSNVGSAHGISDANIIQRNASYAAFEAINNLNGPYDYNHYVSFQANPRYNSNGTIQNIYALSSTPTIFNGTVTSLKHINIADALGSGTITAQYALFIGNLQRGGTNYGIYQNGPDMKNYFSGYVGIGTTPTTSAALHLKKDNGLGKTMFTIGSGDATNDTIYGFSVSNNSLYIFESGKANVIVINNTYVGIGTNSPLFPLDVYGNDHIAHFYGDGAGFTRIMIDTVTTEDSEIVFQEAGSSKWSIGNDGTDDSLHIKNGFGVFDSNSPFVITDSNLVGIGTTSPTQKLTVNGNLNVTGNVYVGGCIVYNSTGIPVTLGTCI